MGKQSMMLGFVFYAIALAPALANPSLNLGFEFSLTSLHAYEDHTRRMTACEENRRTALDGISDDESLLDETRRGVLADNFCSVLHGAMSEQQASAECKFTGSELHVRCGFLKLIDADRLGQLRRVPGTSAAQKVSRCRALIEDFARTSLVVNDCVLANSATRLADEQQGIDRRQVIVDSGVTQNCTNASNAGEASDSAVAPRQCNEFKDTPLAGTEFDQVFSRFIVGYKDFSTSALRFNPMNWGSKGACLSCFRSKYETVQQLASLEPKDFSARQEQTRKRVFSDFAVRKTEEALSEFLKAVERQRFLHTTFAVPLQECEAIKQIDRQIARCSTGDHFRAVLAEFRRRHGGAEGDGVAALLTGAAKRYEAQIDKSDMALGCAMDIQYGAYVSFLHKKIATDNYAPSKLVTPEVRAGLQRCGESDQRCFLEVITKAKLAGVSPESEAGKRIGQDVRSQFRQPFFRSLLSHRENLLYYGDSGDITSARPYRSYVEENRDRFAAVAQKDFEVACGAFVNDVTLALCTKESDASKTYSGEGYKIALSDLLKTNGDASDPKAQGDNLIQLAVACELLNEGSASDREKAIHESRAAADQVADRGHVADVLLRFGNVTPPSNSDKQRAYFEDFVEDSCRAAREEYERERELAQQRLRLDQSARRTAATQTFFDDSVLGAGLFATSTGLGLKTTPSSWNPLGSSPLAPRVTSSNLAGNGIIDNGMSCSPAETLGGSGAYDLRFESTLPKTGWSVSLNLGADNDPLFSGRSTFGSSLGDPARIGDGLASLGTTDIPKKVEVHEAALVTAPDQGRSELGGTLARDISEAPETGILAGFVQGAGEVAANISVGRAPASAAVVPGGYASVGSPVRRAGDESEAPVRRASERQIEEMEDRQSRLEQQLLSQAKESAAVADLRQQTQIEQLRLELERIRVSNQQLMSSMKTLSQPRREKSQENLFDELPASELSSVAAADEVSAPRGPVRANSQLGPASRAERAPVSRSSFTEASAPQSAAATVPKASAEVAVASATAPQAAATSVSVARAGTQAASANRLIASASTSFSPSTSLSRTITGETPVESLPQEKKIELLREFLSYVEKNPVHREGRYLGDNNDQITIDYEGRMMIVRVDDIQDQEVRQQLQERLARQRLAINQTVRASRLESLRRLLASSRGGN